MGSDRVRVSETWRYALLGGVGSIPVTLFLYWLSGLGSELSLNMVLVGGLVAGYLSKRGSADAKSAGFRAGMIGGLPGVWFLYDRAAAFVGIAEPLPLQAMAVAMLIGLTGFVLVISGIAGLIGAKVGAWLATKDLLRQLPMTGH